MDRTDAAPPTRSQSALPPLLFWALLAAVVLRVVTAVMDRSPGETAEGLVRWQPREKAAELARSGGKPVLYDFTAAWCGPCKLLDQDWADSSVARRVNDAFVPARVVDRVREDGQNPPEVAELQRLYEVAGFPTLVIADADGRLIAKMDGYRGRAGLDEFLAKGAAGKSR